MALSGSVQGIKEDDVWVDVEGVYETSEGLQSRDSIVKVGAEPEEQGTELKEIPVRFHPNIITEPREEIPSKVITPKASPLAASIEVVVPIQAVPSNSNLLSLQVASDRPITPINTPKANLHLSSGVILRHPAKPPELAPEQKEANFKIASRSPRKKSCLEKVETGCLEPMNQSCIEPMKKSCFEPLVKNFRSCWAGMFKSRNAAMGEQAAQAKEEPGMRV